MPNLSPAEWRIVAMIAAIKVVVFLYGASSFQILEDKTIGGVYGWFEMWNRWDALHYLNLAQHGYQATGEERFLLVFYPLFPWLTRCFAFLTRDYLTGAILVATFASIAAGLILRRLVQLDFSNSVPDRAVVFLFIFPTSYFLHIGYTEGLFLALVLGSFLSARSQRWWLAGFLGALACLTRVNGVILIPALAVEAFSQFRSVRRWQWSWLWIAFPVVGFAGYLLLNAHVTGDPFKFLVFQREHWFKALTWPWVGIRGTYNAMWNSTSHSQMVGVQEMVFVLLGLVGTVWCWIKLRPAYAIWMTGNWLLFTSTSFVLSVPRYTLVMFPLFILFAQLASRFIWRVVIAVWSLMFLGLFAAQFVRGRWAF